MVLHFDGSHEGAHADLAAKYAVALGIMDHGIRYDIALGAQPRHDHDVYVTDLVA
ncbi:hypothetical protein D3C87_1911430 [compost metagenome]